MTVDMSLSLVLGAVMLVLAGLGIPGIGDALGKWRWLVALGLVLIGIGTLSAQGSRTGEVQQAERQHREQAANMEASLGKRVDNAVKLITSLMVAEPSAPRPVAVPSRLITRRDAEIANKLGVLRHEGRKRYLQWLVREPGAEEKAEAWRIEVVGVLDAAYGPKISSRFNEPSTDEALPIRLPSGQLALLLAKEIEHGHRVDRLGQIIDDIIAGKISGAR